MEEAAPLSFESKLQQLLARVDDGLDKSEGSVIYDALAPIAMQLWIEESKFRSILEQAFAVTAEGRFLDLIAKDYGLERTPAAASKATLEFIGAIGAAIPDGTTVGIENSDVAFATIGNHIIGRDKKATVPARCKRLGPAGNVNAGTIRLLFDPVKDILSVTNLQPATGGLDQEPDVALRERILYQKRNPEHGGTESDYKRWALSVTGVTYAAAINRARGLGTVDVVVDCDAEGEARKPIFDEVRALIERKKPLGVDVHVGEVQPVSKTFVVRVVDLAPDAAKQAIHRYLRTVEIGGTIYRSKIVAAVIVAGASDAIVLEPAENVTLPESGSLKAVVEIV